MTRARVSECIKGWTEHLRSREFTLVLISAVFGSAYLCDWAKVPDAHRRYVITAFTVSVGISYILNPKSVGWMTEAPALLEMVKSLSQSLAAMAAQPTKDEYDALTDPLDNPTKPAAAPTTITLTAGVATTADTAADTAAIAASVAASVAAVPPSSLN